MSPETVLIASAILGVLLVPSLITGRPSYADSEDLQIDTPGISQPAE